MKPVGVGELLTEFNSERGAGVRTWEERADSGRGGGQEDWRKGGRERQFSASQADG